MVRARDSRLDTPDLVASAARFDVSVFVESLRAAVETATGHRLDVRSPATTPAEVRR